MILPTSFPWKHLAITKVTMHACMVVDPKCTSIGFNRCHMLAMMSISYLVDYSDYNDIKLYI